MPWIIESSGWVHPKPAHMPKRGNSSCANKFLERESQLHFNRSLDDPLQSHQMLGKTLLEHTGIDQLGITRCRRKVVQEDGQQ